MSDIISFLGIDNPNVRLVLLGVVLMCSASGVTGVFAYLRKRSLTGDAISHAVLPGIVLSFMIMESKNPFFLLVGAFISGWLAVLAVDAVTRYTKLKSDAAVSMSLSVFYGIGILLLTSLQNTGNGSQAGLDRFLFGRAAALLYEDLVLFACFSLLLIVLTPAFFNVFRLVIFDPGFSKVSGFPVFWLDTLLTTLTVLAVTVGIQAVGVVLMVALLITPAASARYWTQNLSTMIVLAALFGGLSGAAGTLISYALPKMPTGPWVIMALSLTAFLSVLFGRKKGVFRHLFSGRKNSRPPSAEIGVQA